MSAEAAFGADLASDAGHFAGERPELIDHRVDRVFQFKDLALDIDGDLLGEIAVGDRGGDVGDVADLGGQVAGHRVDVVGQVLPDARDPLDIGLTAELAVGPDLASDAGHFAGERPELVHHRVDRVFQLKDLAADIDSDLFRQVAVGNRGGDLGDIADLGGQVARH